MMQGGHKKRGSMADVPLLRIPPMAGFEERNEKRRIQRIGLNLKSLYLTRASRARFSLDGERKNHGKQLR